MHPCLRGYDLGAIMIRIDASSRIPIHEQVKTGLKELVEKGLLLPGDQVPTAKTLAESLVISPAAVARAYRELIKEGFLESKRGEGNWISNRLNKPSDQLMDLVQQLVQRIRACADAGLSWEEISAILQFVRSQPGKGSGEKTGSGLLQHLEKFAAGARTPEGFCPYCREKIQPQELKSLCLICGTAHHQECWNERNHCSVFGCKGTTQIQY